MSSDENLSSEEGFSSPGGSLTDQDWTTTLDQTLEHSSVTEIADAESGPEVSVALPPSLSTERSVNEVALTGSAALDALDQLLANNEIGKERAAKLRRKYNELRDNLVTSRQLENTLLLEAKSLEHKLFEQKKVLERGANFPESDNSETGQLRQNLLTHQNELDQTEERIAKLDHEIAMLEEELCQVEKEYSRQPKKEEIEQHTLELIRQRDDLKSETDKREEDTRRLREDLDKKNYKISVIRQETDELVHVQELLQGELIEIRNRPSIPKEIDNIKRKQREVQQGIKDQILLLEEIQPQLDEGEGRMNSLKTDVTELVKDLRDNEQRLETEQINLDLIHKDISTAKEREATFHEDRATLELQWKHRCLEQKALLESLSKKNKEKERELKALKKAELQLGILKEQREQVSRRVAALENKSSEQQAIHDAIQEKREEITREVDSLRKTLQLADGVSGEYSAVLENLQLTEQRLKAEIKRQMGIMLDLSKQQVSMTKSRDVDAKEFYKTQRHQYTISDDLRSKEGELDEHRKRITELQVQLKDFAAAYEVVKTERNKIHSHIQLLHQIGAELAEKSKILQNETEILRTTAVTKERLLQKCSLVTTAKTLERDSQRQEVAKLKQAQAELNSELGASREEISKLTQQINAAEQQLSRLRRHYEHSVQDRNDLGLQLIERNEEVCVFYEKTSVQDSNLRKANMELSAREEEIRFLKMDNSRFQNDILVKRKYLPMKDKIELDLVNAQVELKTCQEHLQELEQAVECASDPTRVRLLGGDNPSRRELNIKVNNFEKKLSECERHLLEKELLYEQVSKLTDRANRRVDSQRESTLSVAKKVNTFQTKIKESNRKMMALVSELSMTQAKALAVQQESKQAELKLEQAYTRLANGEPPEEECKGQWEKILRQKERKHQEDFLKRKLMEEEESRMLPGGSLSHADPRPNAYMPVGEDELPIPKPYGSHAPFKPSLPGANLRHIRKPDPKPIDI